MQRHASLVSRLGNILSTSAHSSILNGSIESMASKSSQGGFASSLVARRTAATSSPSTPRTDTFHVPLGHHSTTLDSVNCNIGLNRRRDITLRREVTLSDLNETPHSLASLFRNRNTIVIGVPGGGVCIKQHIPEYGAALEELKKRGIAEILCITQDTPSAAAQWAKTTGVDPSRVRILSDAKGYFTRMLGVEIAGAPGGGARNQRYAGYVEDGLLLKLFVENKPGDFKVSSVANIKQFIDTVVLKGNVPK